MEQNLQLKPKKYKVKQPISDKIFDITNAVLMVFFLVITIVPLLYLIACAFSQTNVNQDVILLPRIAKEGGGSKIGLTFEHFKYIITDANGGMFLNSFKNTAIITVCVTLGSNILMALAAYPLSKVNCPYRKGILMFFIIVMLFSAGIIPSYLIMVKVGLTENILGLILISLTNVFNLLLFKTTFEGIPKELEESAQLDGASSLQMFFKIIIPITIPTFASCCFFTFVGCINSYGSAVLFVRTNEQAKPLAQFLFELVSQFNDSNPGVDAAAKINVQSAGILLSIIPILAIYPFIIRYIKSGVTLGSVKG